MFTAHNARRRRLEPRLRCARYPAMRSGHRSGAYADRSRFKRSISPVEQHAGDSPSIRPLRRRYGRLKLTATGPEVTAQYVPISRGLTDSYADVLCVRYVRFGNGYAGSASACCLVYDAYRIVPGGGSGRRRAMLLLRRQ